MTQVSMAQKVSCLSGNGKLIPPPPTMILAMDAMWFEAFPPGGSISVSIAFLELWVFFQCVKESRVKDQNVHG